LTFYPDSTMSNVVPHLPSRDGEPASFAPLPSRLSPGTIREPDLL